MKKPPIKKAPIKPKSALQELPLQKVLKKKPPKKKAKRKLGKVVLPIPRTPKSKTVEEAILKESSRVSLQSRASNAKTQANISDIANVPPYTQYVPIDLKAINWERRTACRKDPLLDLQTYFPQVFYLPWADFQKDLIHSIEDRIRFGGKKAFGLPRGTGKTAICRAMIPRASKYDYRKFCFFIGSKEPKALQTLDFIKGYWYRNTDMRQDFPEIAYPIYRIDGRSSVGINAQTFRGERTHLTWKTNEVQFPTLQFDEEDVQGYLKHEPESVIWLPDRGINIEKFIIASSGTIIRVAGVDGSIRGEAELHPILLTQPRPDLVLLDDVQKDQRASSPKACEDLSRLIESAIDYLAAPDITQATLMPCTVIREGDVSDTYLNPLEKAEWGGERRGIIDEYPPGIDDNAIFDEINGVLNEQGKKWLEYKETREESYRNHNNLKLANAFYKKHRKVLDKGFSVSWNDRFKNDSDDENINEVSAIQAAMNWRFKDHESFLSEGQNKPRSRMGDSSNLLSPAEIAEHITRIPQSQISGQWTNVVCFIDVQDEILFYTLFAHDHAFNGQFIEYGTFPSVRTRFFRKSQLAGWSLLTKLYYKDHPNERPIAVKSGKSTKIRAPFDAKITHALNRCCDWLLERKFPRLTVHAEDHLGIKALGIDTKWGTASETTKRFVRERANPVIISCEGQAFLPSHLQLEEYEERSGWLFEHQQFPGIAESKWVLKPRSDGSQYLYMDVNRLKTFLMKRLSTSLGGSGCITLHAPPNTVKSAENQLDPPEIDNTLQKTLMVYHRMFAEHLGYSEYPEPIHARGLTKDCWQPRPANRSDNDYFDCVVGCMALASLCGASIKTGKEKPKTRRNMQEVYDQQQVRKSQKTKEGVWG